MQQNPISVRVRIPRDQFGRYLRTGFWMQPADEIEVKFNPWHDPANGRFTFKGSGFASGGGHAPRGSRGGGGSGGGGGASGTWRGGGFTGGGRGGGSFDGGGSSASWANDASRARQKSATTGPAATSQIIRAPAATNQYGSSWHDVTRNGYTYRLDATDRTRQVTGTLTLNQDQTRSRTAQAGAGGRDRLPTDDGGHYVARRFNGPTDAFNHFAQDATFNRGGYRALENEWAKDMRAGKAISVKIIPSYSGSSRRPSSINVFYSVNGQPKNKNFPNASKGKTHAK